ncbi:MAG: hypothetical protein J5602_04600, partial [Clostridia bacterium]|nr:hypothetical protein [Clostridia bacterium]
GSRREAAKPLRRAAFFLMKRVRADRLEADINVDTGDACGTALLTALLGAALSALAAAYPAAPLKRRVSCSFRGEGAARLMGIFSTRAGYIMLAALVFGRDYCFGRIRAWTNTPSKTS